MAFAGAFGQPTPTHLDYTVSEGTWISGCMAPNGKQIVFELVGDLYVIPIEGVKPETGRRTAFQSHQDILNGNQIAFISDESGSETYGYECGRNEPAPNNETVPSLSDVPEWSSDGKHIYVTQTDGQGMRGAGLTKGRRSC